MKAILVVDLPNDIFIDDCRIEFRVIENVMEMCVADGIKRLKPLPKMVKVFDDAYVSDYLDFDLGWNDCLNKILGEEE